MTPVIGCPLVINSTISLNDVGYGAGDSVILVVFSWLMAGVDDEVELSTAFKEDSIFVPLASEVVR